MKTLFIGGIKSGKSRSAENYIKQLSKTKPVYLATTEFIDDEMQERIAQHQQQRKSDFITVEEAINLREKIALQEGAVLVECLSMWINNMLYHEKNYTEMEAEIATIMELKQDIVFVINDVGCGIIPENKLARQFVDISGKLAQLVAQKCDEVYHVVAGISTQIK
ncbi:bifunctional adenosylcobinamide kinase/adenosylcobinamide-phosphate guanylyltransferase [Sulfurimonas sp. SWIR-19]|uniref:bifunctional adenosylcobinamide kinase/adenosylcobinamide-phosphate guanylyltransferase n=1 Tax=Sulfurimonas sp. SWIR-19 TaxID=2878390 RepID=UPI001CF438CB|nr:bifunctional adenosylcobinamide kinase/adenosylcobinamide-phosphate guanylyltransferase [Sulfurimonas sp. SWIR-19]UCN00383.1 bifunctional adenosylcobinamide kinase/adenosylcobinamide-phosphate guanylyltransferase [Sulfurimonas sp. SWIR-19]